MWRGGRGSRQGGKLLLTSLCCLWSGEEGCTWLLPVEQEPTSPSSKDLNLQMVLPPQLSWDCSPPGPCTLTDLQGDKQGNSWGTALSTASGDTADGLGLAADVRWSRRGSLRRLPPASAAEPSELPRIARWPQGKESVRQCRRP